MANPPTFSRALFFSIVARWGAIAALFDLGTLAYRRQTSQSVLDEGSHVMFQESSGVLVSVHLEIEDEECSINCWYCGENDTTPGPPGNLLAVFRSVVEGPLRGVLSDTSYIVGYSTNPQEPNAAQRVDYPIGRLAGSVAGDPPNPTNIAAHYFLRQSEISQRTFRRVYVPGLPEAWYVSGQWDTTTFELELQNLGEALVEPLSGGGLSETAVPCVRHRTNPGVLPATFEFYAVTFWQLTLKAAHQRRRTIYQPRAWGTGTAENLPDIGTPPVLTPVIGFSGGSL